MTNLYRYIVVGLFLLCLTFLVINIRATQDEIADMETKVTMLEAVNKIHFNTLLTINNDLDEVIDKQEELAGTLQEHDELIMQLERMQNLN